ncbi:hypothetical protein MKY04_19050 [Lysinibacillus telephonicus]|uniref:hypothetical protein n=1 Tax=Lysinibacillus telephonicus TaxID=1714840 RepID=UPI0031FE1F78
MFNVLMVYFLIVFIYLIIEYRKDQKNFTVKMLIAFFCPFIGLIILYFMFHHIKNEERSIPDGLIKKVKSRQKYYVW